MARLQIATAHVDADLAVFDKDGTLIDFHGVWGPRGIRAVAATWNAVLDPQKGSEFTVSCLKSWWDGLFHIRGIPAI